MTPSSWSGHGHLGVRDPQPLSGAGAVGGGGPARVALVVTRLDRGGAARVVLQLAAGLSRERFEPLIVTGRTVDPEEPLEAYQARTGVGIHVVPGLRREPHPWLDLATLGELTRLFRRLRPALVHTHTSKAGILGRWAARFAGIRRVVHSTHGHIFYGYYGPVLTRLFTGLEALTARVTNRIVTLTEAEIEDHLRRAIGRREQFRAVPCGMLIEPDGDPTRVRRIREAVLQVPPHALVVGAVGRLVPVKGLAYFLAACRVVRQRCPTLAVVVIGEGPERRHLEAQAEALGLGETVRFLGDRRDVPQLLAACDLVVLSSVNEGLGLVLIEAAAAGRAVVATRVGGVPDVVVHGQTGLLVPPEDSDALAEAVGFLLARPHTRVEMGRRAAARARVQFGLEAMIRRTEAVYGELLGAPVPMVGEHMEQVA